LEYIRTFLLGRMAWSRLNGLLIVSGAFGAFRKEIVIDAGGYDTRTVGEDMELVVRMRRYMEERRLPYRIKYISDPLCWTEGPSNYKILGRQRSRWMRGTVETLYAHRQMFLNPSYHLLGMLSYPYWFFFELLAPVIEFTGFMVFCILAILHMIAWAFFWKLLLFILGVGYLYSVFGILMEVLTCNQYNKPRDTIRLLFTIFMEPFLFHPFIVWSSMKGLVELFRKKTGWGEMTRKGFQRDSIVAK
ncbi:MAG: glycosyltransferase, partial [Rhabdochlamydiaceae bacterium]